MLNKPYSESCDQNREPILSVIEPLLRHCTRLLEIGSGTGQHAVYFGRHLPGLKWQSSDCPQYLPGIRMWIEDAGLDNVLPPIELDVCRQQWPSGGYDAVFTANSLHIMNDEEMACLIRGVAGTLDDGGQLLVYGPFNYDGQYTSDSNESFDEWLKARDPSSGIKHFEDVCRLAQQQSLSLVKDYPMPANNRLLHLRKSG